MILTRKTSTMIAAPREHVAATLVRTDLDAVTFYDPRVISVATNGLPDGAEGQVVHMVGRVYGQEVEIVQTTLTSRLPEYVVDHMSMLSDSVVTTTRLTAVGETTRIDQVVEFDIPTRKIFTIAATALSSTSQLRKALARFTEFAELTYRAG